MAVDKKKPVLSDKSKPSTREEKEKALTAAMGQIEKAFGKGAIMRLGDGSHLNVEMVPTGSLGLDIALGGGFPVGRISEIYGPESSGKTTVALSAIASAQREGRQCAFIDAEHALDPRYAQQLGVDIDNLLISQPDTGEQALEITDALVRSGAVGLIVVDSVAALVPKSELEGEIGDAQMGLQARMMGQAMRKLAGEVSKTKTIVIFINQLRMKIGVMFGNPETTTGGNALKFYASVRLDVRSRTIKEGDQITGKDTTIKVVKNKVSPPFKQASYRLMFGQGISRSDEILELGVKLKLINKTGAWYDYLGEKLGNGRNNAVTWLNEHPDIAAEIEGQIREKAFNNDPDLSAIQSASVEETLEVTDTFENE